MKGLNPGQQVVKVVSDELTKVLGSEEVTLKFSEKSPTVYMLIGLQGAGKTTHAGKLAKYINKNYGKKILLVACDVYRPAAIDQLITIGSQVETDVFSEGTISPVKIAEDAIKKAKDENYERNSSQG